MTDTTLTLPDADTPLTVGQFRKLENLSKSAYIALRKLGLIDEIRIPGMPNFINHPNSAADLPRTSCCFASEAGGRH